MNPQWEKQVSGCLSMGVEGEMVDKPAWGNSQGYGKIYYLNCEYGFMGVYIRQNLSNGTL